MIRKSNSSRLAFCAALIILILCLVGCAARKPVFGDPETGLILTYRMAPDQIWKYTSTTNQNMNMEVMGNTMDTETLIYKAFTVRGKGMDKEKNLKIEMVVDSMSMKIISPNGKQTIDTSPVIGKWFGLTLSPYGKELEFTGNDSIALKFGGMGGEERNVKSFFREAFGDLPEEPVKIGDIWTTEDKVSENQSGMDINVNSENVYTLAGFEVVDGLDCAKITIETTGALDGAGEQMGMDLTFEGDIESTSTFYFAYKEGYFVKVSAETFMEGTIAASGAQNMTIPMTQESKIEVRFIK
jgi:hypothetical protein